MVFILGGRFNPKMIIENGLKPDYFKFILQFLEKVAHEEDVCRRNNGGAIKVVGVIDLEGLTFSKIAHVESKSIPRKSAQFQ